MAEASAHIWSQLFFFLAAMGASLWIDLYAAVYCKWQMQEGNGDVVNEG